MEQDLRVEKTIASLTDAFLSLIKERPLEKITVTEICSRARLSRVTYYNYYLDIYDQYAYLKRKYFDASEDFFSYHGDSAPGREETKKILADWLDTLDKGMLGDIFIAIVRTQGVTGFLEEYHREIGHSILGSFDGNSDIARLPGGSTELMLTFCEGGWTTLILKWLTEKPRRYESSQIAGCIIEMILKRENTGS